MRNRLGLFVLAFVAVAAGYALGRFGASAVPSATDAAARSDGIAELREQLAALETQLQAARAELPSALARATTATPAPQEMGGAADARSLLGSLPALPQLSQQQKRTVLRQNYGEVFRELALSPREVDALLDVLSAQHGSGFGTFGARDALSPELTAAISAAIGPAKAAQFEQAQNTMPARTELTRARTQLERVGDPMTEEQQQKLLAALSTREPIPPYKRSENSTPQDNTELFRAWKRDSAESLRDSATGVLTSSQLERLQESQALMEAIQTPLRAPTAGAPAPVH